MQALDVNSTYRRLAGERSKPIPHGRRHRQQGRVPGDQGAVALSTVLAARHMAKRNKVVAIATLVAINGHAVGVDHNYRARGVSVGDSRSPRA